MNISFESLLFRTAFLLAVTMVSICAGSGAALSIAAASDLTYALSEVIALYEKDNAGATVNVTYGSSGKLCTQISQGAPYDLFLSADIAYPEQLIAKGVAVEPVVPYGLGRIVLWSATCDVSGMSLTDLRADKFKHIAIADPSHAPYGLRAMQSLEAAGLWATLKPRIVFGENIVQAAQFVYSGNADAGIIALSVALAPDLAKRGGYTLIPDSLHEPLVQALVVTMYGEKRNRSSVRNFVGYMTTPQACAIMEKSGFSYPEATSTATRTK